MKKILQIIAISCMPFLSGVAAADEYDRYTFAEDPGFDRMGFGFAQPIITLIPGYTNADGSSYRPVMIIAGGYDPTKDYIGSYGDENGGAADIDPDGIDGRAPANETISDRYKDKVGNAIYFLDAINGKLIARVLGSYIIGSYTLPSGGTDKTLVSVDSTKKISSVGSLEVNAGDLPVPGLEHSIPATVTAVDSQGDGITDRVYFIDVVGNIWRLDLIVPDSKNAITQNWNINKFAALGADGVSTNFLSNDRRFFNQLDVVRTRRPDGLVDVDAILVGSGNIANPKEEVAEGHNAFYMLYDENIHPSSATIDAADVIKIDNLVDVTAASISADDVEDKIDGTTDTKKGWYLPLAGNEKVMSSSTTVGGIAYFTTIIANPDAAGCIAPEALPTSSLYALRIHNAKGAHIDVLGDDNTPTTYKRFVTKSSLAFQQIDPYVSIEGDVSIVIDGTKTPLKDGDDAVRKLQGAGSYWRTDDQ